MSVPCCRTAAKNTWEKTSKKKKKKKKMAALTARESWERALYGTILSLMEKKRVSRVSTLAIPAVFLAVEFVQMASVPASALASRGLFPTVISAALSASVLVDSGAAPETHRAQQTALFAAAVGLLAVSVASLLALARELRTGTPHPRRWLRVLVG
jgi:hypothetical protein